MRNLLHVYARVLPTLLPQVTLLEDSTPVLGKLVAIDSGQAVIDISSKDEAGVVPSSSSGSISSLKIYRVSQLQVVTPAASPPPSLSQGASPRRSTLGSQGAKPSVRLSACRQQAAGVVQKQPVCIINANHDTSAESLFDISAPGTSTSESLIAGFKPLTAILIDEKPLILVQRLCDKKVFLLLSSKSSGTILQPSSFIAVGTGKSQPLKCTVEEESILSADAGFVGHSIEDIKAFYSSGLDPSSKETGMKGKQSQKKVGQKRGVFESAKEEPVPVLLEPARTPELYSNSTGSILLLQDLAGGVYALKNGLALSHCVSSSNRSDEGYGFADTAFSALAIEERTLDNTTSCIVFVLGKGEGRRQQNLFSCTEIGLGAGLLWGDILRGVCVLVSCTSSHPFALPLKCNHNCAVAVMWKGRAGMRDWMNVLHTF